MKKKRRAWYPISFLGGLIVSLYGLIPPFMIYVDSLGLLPSITRMGTVAGMLFVSLCASVARRKGHKLFSRKGGDLWNGFTLIELLIVISIIGVLSAIILPAVLSTKNKAYLARAKVEFKSVVTALEIYAGVNGGYPPDANRDIPPGLEAYLGGNNWPRAPWPGSFYDWDAWAPSDLSYEPKQQVYQISIRFCPADQPTQCLFPNEPWAQNFDYYSAAYYCISGPCRAHSSQPPSHPAYCVNCQ